VDNNLRPAKTIRQVIAENDRRINMILNMFFYGGIVIVILSGIIKFLINKL